MFNFFFYGKDKEKQAYTKRLFSDIAAEKYEPYTSNYVIDEIADAPKQMFDSMRSLIDKYKITVLPESDEIKRLGAIYISKGIIPEKYKDDALHIASATVNGLDFVISYNYNHIIKLKTIIGTSLVNMREGRKQMGLSTPKEILDYDNNTLDC
jgi:hypothetical protein